MASVSGCSTPLGCLRSLPLSCHHTHTHMQVHTHTHIHTHKQTHRHTQACTHVHSYEPIPSLQVHIGHIACYEFRMEMSSAYDDGVGEVTIEIHVVPASTQTRRMAQWSYTLFIQRESTGIIRCMCTVSTLAQHTCSEPPGMCAHTWSYGRAHACNECLPVLSSVQREAVWVG